MATSKKISELTTATALVGDELLPLVQDGETRQAEVSVLRLLSPVQSVNGLTGNVLLALGDLTGVEPIVSAQGVSAAIAAVSARVDTVSVLVSTNYQALVSAVASVSVRVDTVSAAITSVQAYVLAQISVATSGTFIDAPSDGSIYARQNASWVALQAAYDIGFDFGSGQPTTSATQGHLISRNVLIPLNLSGSVAWVSVNPTAPVTFAIRYAAVGSTASALGSVIVSTNGTYAYNFSSLGVAVTASAGAKLFMDAPAVQDATLAGALFTIITNRL